LQPIETKFDRIILDAGYDEQTENLLQLSDEVLVVTNPHLAAVTDALKVIKQAETHATVIGVVVNQTGSAYDMSKVNIEAMLEYPVIAEIPSHREFEKAMSAQQPADGRVAGYYHALADLLITNGKKEENEKH